MYSKCSLFKTITLRFGGHTATLGATHPRDGATARTMAGGAPTANDAERISTLRAPHFLGVHTLALDAPPQRVEELDVWVGAASRDADQHHALTHDVGLMLQPPQGSKVGGAYVRAQPVGAVGPPLHVWLGSRKLSAAAHRVGGYRLRVLDVKHAELPASPTPAAAGSPMQALGEAQETVLVSIAIDRHVDAAAIPATTPREHALPAVVEHAPGGSALVWLSTQRREALTVRLRADAGPGQDGRRGAAGEQVGGGAATAPELAGDDAGQEAAAKDGACARCPPLPRALPPLAPPPAPRPTAGADHTELSLSLHVREVLDAPTAGETPPPPPAGLFGAPRSFWLAAVDAMSVSALAEGHESVALRPAAPHERAGPRPRSARGMPRRATECRAVGEYSVTVVETVGHFCTQPSDADAGSAAMRALGSDAPFCFATEYPIPSVAVCLRVEHCGHSARGRAEREEARELADRGTPPSEGAATAAAHGLADSAGAHDSAPGPPSAEAPPGLSAAAQERAAALRQANEMASALEDLLL